MKKNLNPYIRNAWRGLSGFCLGGIVGALVTFLIFNAGLLSILVEMVSPDQVYPRFSWGIFLAFIGIGLGGAVAGLICGYSLSKIDIEGNRLRYVLGGTFSMGISQGILVIPLLVFISLLNQYNVGSQTDAASFVAVFTLVGGLFGLLNGAILSLITLRIRFAWLAWLSYFAASLVGGAFFGFLMFQPAWNIFETHKVLATLMFLIIAGTMIYGFSGAVLGLVYTWLCDKRQEIPTHSIAPRLWQDVATIMIATVIFISVTSMIRRLANFVSVYQGNVTTSLTSSTDSVGWQDPIIVSDKVNSLNFTDLGLASAVNQFALVWVNGSIEIEYAYENNGQASLPAWNLPASVSEKTEAGSYHPQVALGSDGYGYITWEDGGTIWYNRCRGNSCENPMPVSNNRSECGNGANDQPAISIDQDNLVMVAWQANNGRLGYSVWNARGVNKERKSGCLTDEPTASLPRLANSGPGEFWMVSSTSTGEIENVWLEHYRNGEWVSRETPGTGNHAEVYIDSQGKVVTAWCGKDNKINYKSRGNDTEIISDSCNNRPSIFTDSNEIVHIVYRADKWQDNFGVIRQGSAIMETIRKEGGWSEPTFITLVDAKSQQEVVKMANGDVKLVWIDTIDGNQVLRATTQPAYKCDITRLPEAMKIVLNVIQSGSFHPAGYDAPYCGNHFDELVYMPSPESEFAVLPSGEKDGFDQVANLIRSAHYEVLFSNMQWDQDVNNLSPGTKIAQAFADLYFRVKANPEDYPRGMTVKILLGNYPNLSTMEMGDQIWDAIQDLSERGIGLMEDPSIGWKIEVANYKGSYPHSHTKFIVIDGKTIMTAGFNISWTHLPVNDLSGKGNSMTDLGITMTGPVAQTGVEVFDEMWQGANQVLCKGDFSGTTWHLRQICEKVPATVSHVPDTRQFYLPGDTADAIGLYRTADYKEADDAYLALLSQADESLDILHANFTAELICVVNLIFPDVCTYDNATSYMRSIINGIQNHGIHVRLMVEGTNMNGLENQVGIKIMQHELESLGLEDHMEIRFFDGRLHTKSMLVDNQALIIGSQNFHYSSLAVGGLNEFNMVTDSTEAINQYKKMFDYYWEQGTPATNNK